MAQKRSSSRDRKIPRSDFDTPKLLAQVSMKPVIWDPNRPDHKDRPAIDAAFEEIARNFYGEVTAKECYLKWLKVVQQRADHRRRHGYLPSGSEAKPRKKFKYERETSFLDSVRTDEPCEGNLTENEAYHGEVESECDVMERTILQESQNHLQRLRNSENSLQPTLRKTISFSSDDNESKVKQTLSQRKRKYKKGCLKVSSKVSNSSFETSDELQSTPQKAVSFSSHGDDSQDKKTSRQTKCSKVSSKVSNLSFDLLGTTDEEERGLSGPDIKVEHFSDLPAYKKKKIEKQKEWHLKREELKLKLKEQVERAKNGLAFESVSRRSLTNNTKSECGHCENHSLEAILIEQLKNLQPDDYFGLSFSAMATRLRKLPEKECNEILLIFMEELNKVEDC